MLEALPVPVGGSFPDNTVDMIQSREKTRAELQVEVESARAEAAQYAEMANAGQLMLEEVMQALDTKSQELANMVTREEHLSALAAAERRVREEERDNFDAEREALNHLRQEQQTQFSDQISLFAEQMQVQEQMIEALQAQTEAGTVAPQSPAPAASTTVHVGSEELRKELELNKTKLRVAEERLSTVEEELAAARVQQEESAKELMQAQSKAKLLTKMHDAYKGKSIEEAKRNQSAIAGLERKLAATQAPVVRFANGPAGHITVEESEKYKDALSRALAAEAKLEEAVALQEEEGDLARKKQQSAAESSHALSLESSLQQMKAQLDSVIEERDGLERKVTIQAEALAKQESALRFANKAAEQLSATCSDEREREALQAEVLRLESEVRELKSAQEESAASASMQSAAILAEEGETSRLREQVAELNAKVSVLTGLKAEYAALEEQIKVSAKDASHMADSVLETRGKLQQAIAERKTAEAELEEKKASIVALEEQLTGLTASVTALRQSKALVEEELDLLKASSAVEDAQSSDSTQIVEEIYAKHRLERQRYERELSESQQQVTRMRSLYEETKARAEELKASAAEFSSVAQLATKRLDEEQHAGFLLREELAENEAAIAEKVRLLAEESDKVVDLQQQLAEAQLEAKLAQDCSKEMATMAEEVKKALVEAKHSKELVEKKLEETAAERKALKGELSEAIGQAREETRRAAEQSGRLQAEVEGLQKQLNAERESGSVAAEGREQLLGQQLAAANEAIYALEAEAANVRQQKDELEGEAKRLRSEMVAQIESHRAIKEELQEKLARSEKQVVENLREQRQSLAAFQERYEAVDEQLDTVASQLEIARVTAERLENAHVKFAQLEQLFVDERRQHEETVKQVALEKKRVEIAKELTCDLQRHIIEITNAHNESLETVAELQEQLEEARSELLHERGMFEEEKTSILYDFLHRQYGASSASLSPTKQNTSSTATASNSFGVPYHSNASSRSHSRQPSHSHLALDGVHSEQRLDDSHAQQQQRPSHHQHNVDERAALAQVKRRLVEELWSHSMELTASASRPASTSSHSIGRSKRKG